MRLDLTTHEVTTKLTNSRVYVKHAVVTIHKAQPGETITTTGGEQYLISEQKVTDRYIKLPNGRYQAKGAVRAFRNPTHGPVEITAPWGEVQYGDWDCWIAVAVDVDNPAVIGDDRYLIDGDAFAATYQPVSV